MLRCSRYNYDFLLTLYGISFHPIYHKFLLSFFSMLLFLPFFLFLDSSSFYSFVSFWFFFYSFAVFIFFSQAQSFGNDLLPSIIYSVDSLVPDSVLAPLPAYPVFGEPNPAVFPVASFRFCLCLGTFPLFFFNSASLCSFMASKSELIFL